MPITSQSTTPEQVRDKILSTYMQALREQHIFRQREPRLRALFHDLKLYGTDAGVDFVQTHADEIIQEAIGEAECEQGSLHLTFYGCGNGALKGIAEALRQLTALPVSVGPSSVRLSWAEAQVRSN